MVNSIRVQAKSMSMTKRANGTGAIIEEYEVHMDGLQEYDQVQFLENLAHQQ